MNTLQAEEDMSIAKYVEFFSVGGAFSGTLDVYVGQWLRDLTLLPEYCSVCIPITRERPIKCSIYLVKG